MSLRVPFLIVASFAVACSSSTESPTPAAPDARPGESEDAGGLAATRDAGPSSAEEAAPGTTNIHGTIVDVESLEPAQGLVVTSNGQSATTDTDGHWSLSVPLGSTLKASLTGPDYSLVLFPDLVPMDPDVDLGTTVIPDMNTYQLEEAILGTLDTTKSLIHVLIVTEPTCPSAVGGTVTVTSPSDAVVAYFGTNPIPSSSITTFQQVADGRPVADIYNVDPNATLAIAISHPTCKQVPFPATYGGRQYAGTVEKMAAMPGGVSSALVFVLE